MSPEGPCCPVVSISQLSDGHAEGLARLGWSQHSGESGLGKVQKKQTEIVLSIALFMLQHLNVENK